MTMLQTSNLTPRDLSGMSVLKQHGLSLVEVRISQVSFAKGKLLGNIALPENTRIICVLRNNRAILDLDAVFLEEKDAVYLVTDDEDTVRDTFML